MAPPVIKRHEAHWQPRCPPTTAWQSGDVARQTEALPDVPDVSDSIPDDVNRLNLRSEDCRIRKHEARILAK